MSFYPAMVQRRPLFDIGFWIGALFFLLIILLIAKGLGWI